MPVEVGQIVEGKVSGITTYGAFIQLDDGVVGLVHISEIADDYVKNVSDYLTENQVIKVKVLSIEKSKKISLSIKKVEPKQIEVKKAESFKRNGPPQYRSESNKFDQKQSNDNISFEDRLSKFMKDSEERLQDLKRNFESKRGSGSYKKSAQY